MLLVDVIVCDVTGRGLGRGNELAAIGSCSCTTITKESKEKNKRRALIQVTSSREQREFTIKILGGEGCLSAQSTFKCSKFVVAYNVDGIVPNDMLSTEW